MRSPHPAGARIVLLNERLARLDIGAHEWREELVFTAPPAGRTSADPRSAQLAVTLPHAAARPWAPAHLRARRLASGDVAMSWVRCARTGDTWSAGEPPLGASAESYRLEIFSGDDVVRSVTVASPAYTYAEADQITDFGAPPASLRFRVAQMVDSGATGLNSELTITL